VVIRAGSPGVQRVSSSHAAGTTLSFAPYAKHTPQPSGNSATIRRPGRARRFAATITCIAASLGTNLQRAVDLQEPGDAVSAAGYATGELGVDRENEVEC
jgi:hypothetical protein